MNAISRWAHLKYLLSFPCRCGEPIRQLREWKRKLSPVHLKPQPTLFDDNLFHIVIVIHSSSSVQTHPTVGECSRNVQTQSFSPHECLAHSSDKKMPLRDRSRPDPANTCTPSPLCAHAHAEFICFVRVEKESPTENLENCRHTRSAIIQKEDAAAGLCTMPSRNIPILREMRQARCFRSPRTSSASFLPQSSTSNSCLSPPIAASKWTEHQRPADADGLKALETVEPGRVRRKMIVCRAKVPFRLPDGTWVVNTSDALKRLAST